MFKKCSCGHFVMLNFLLYLKRPITEIVSSPISIKGIILIHATSSINLWFFYKVFLPVEFGQRLLLSVSLNSNCIIFISWTASQSIHITICYIKYQYTSSQNNTHKSTTCMYCRNINFRLSKIYNKNSNTINIIN